MLPLAFAFIVFFFLFVGAVAFVVCALVPPLRRFALSTSLWMALWGPCAVVWITLAGAAIVSGALISKTGRMPVFHAPQLLRAVGWSYLAFGILGTLVLSTGVAWVHQALIRRVTYPLFRIYATLVSAGIGSVFGWAFGLWITANQIRFGWILWLAGMLTLITVFGIAAYTDAGQLRGSSPNRLTWITPEEFAGS